MHACSGDVNLAPLVHTKDTVSRSCFISVLCPGAIATAWTSPMYSNDASRACVLVRRMAHNDCRSCFAITLTRCRGQFRCDTCDSMHVKDHDAMLYNVYPQHVHSHSRCRLCEVKCMAWLLGIHSAQYNMPANLWSFFPNNACRVAYWDESKRCVQPR